MPIPVYKKAYIHNKTKEAYNDLKKVSNIYSLDFSFFNISGAIAVPKIDKVESLDILLNNISNIFKTISYFSQLALASIAQNSQVDTQNPIVRFCVDSFTSMMYDVVKTLELVTDFIFKRDKESDNSIEMSEIKQST